MHHDVRAGGAAGWMERHVKRMRRSRLNIDCASTKRARGRGTAAGCYDNPGTAKTVPKVHVRTQASYVFERRRVSGGRLAALSAAAGDSAAAHPAPTALDA